MNVWNEPICHNGPTEMVYYIMELLETKGKHLCLAKWQIEQWIGSLEQ